MHVSKERAHEHAEVIEMLAESDKSWEDAAQVEVANASKISFVLGD
jgi:dodecin